MEFLASLFVIVFIAIWARGRFRAMEERLAEDDRRIAALTTRIFHLESARQALPPALHPQAATPPPVTPQPEPVPFAPPPVFEPVPVFAPPPVPEPDFPTGPPAIPQPAYEAAAALPESKPALDVEALIGGNILSKLGVLILLIGIALFLGFSIVAMGPLGRVAVGVVTGAALLGGGIFAEKKEQYRTMGRALIGGGWAGLYFTAFASHGLEAARVIDNPGAGFILLMAVAAGMIGHSLRYRSQAVTGLAFLAGFLTIAISSLTKFSAVASVPLLLSLLAVSWKFGWHRLAAAGAAFAYTAYGFDLASGDKDRYFITIGEPVLWTYWVILELFDLASLRRYREGLVASYFPVAPFNLSGFLMATAAVWPSSGWQPDLMFGSMAVMQVISALLRGKRLPDGTFEDSSTFGGFRASMTFSSGLTVACLFQRFDGLTLGMTLACQAQFIALLGWLLRSPYLRELGAFLFLFPLAAGSVNLPDGGAAKYWPTLFYVLTVLGFVNRLFLSGGVWYTVGATFTLGTALVDLRPTWLQPLAATIAAGAASVLLRWKEKSESPLVGTAFALLSVGMLAVHMPVEKPLLAMGFPAVLYALVALSLQDGLPRVGAWGAMQLFLAAMLYRLIGLSVWLPPIWAAQALGSWYFGARRSDWSLAASALLPETIAIVYWMDRVQGTPDGLVARALTAAAIFAMHLIHLPEEETEDIARLAAPAQIIAAALLFMAVLEDAVSGRMLTLAWSAEAFALLGAGFALRERVARLSGLTMFGFCLAKLFFYDFATLDTLSRILSFIVLGLLLLATSWAYNRFREEIKRLL